MADLTPMDFGAAIEANKLDVTIAGEKYILAEATGDAAVKYRNQAIAGAKMVDGKVTGFRNVADVEPLLVSLCLWKLTDDGRLSAVTEKTVRSWPSHYQKDLFERAKSISNLDDGDNPLRQQLISVLTNMGRLSELHEYLADSEDEEFRDLKDLVKPTTEEEAKNGQRGLEVGSD